MSCNVVKNMHDRFCDGQVENIAHLFPALRLGVNLYKNYIQFQM